MMIVDEELRSLYDLSSREQLQSLQAGLLILQQLPDDEATLEELRRSAHRLKGDSRTVGVASVESLLQQVEKILKGIQSKQLVLTAALGDRLQQGIEAIGKLIHEAVTGQPSEVDMPQVLDLLLEAVAEPPQPAALTDSVASPTAPAWIEDAELRYLYDFSSQERCQNLKAGLLYLQQHPTDQATLEALQREAHSLQGDSRSVGLEAVEILAQQLEEILIAIQSGQIAVTATVSDRLAQAVEALSQLAREAVTRQASGVEVPQVFDLLLEASAQRPEPLRSPQPRLIEPLASSFIDDEELREVYRDACRERLQKLETGLLHLEKQPDSEATLELLLREAHSLKGDSRSVGVETVEVLTHQFEEVLGACKRQQIVLTADISDCLYQGLDAIGKLVREAVMGQPSQVDVALLLDRFSATLSAAAQPAGTFASALPPLPVPESLPEPEQPDQIETVRVQTSDLDALLARAEELIVAKIGVTQAANEIEAAANLWREWKASRSQGHLSPATANAYPDQLEKIINSLRSSTQENSSQISKISEELRDRIRTLRLLPLSTVFQLFPRAVRDLAKQQSKQVELIVEGGDTSADKSILEGLRDSLMHMVRNAIDHGIETPQEREQLGKPPTAKIWLRGYQAANAVVVEVRDDGRGLDLDKIKQTAARRGLYSPEELAAMTPSQVQNLIFAPGFSTRTFITELSGRGIGLDVVGTNVGKLKGEVQVESVPNQGCTFRIQISTKLSTINAVLFEVQGVTHALPIEFMQTTLLISQSQISTHEGRAVITFGDREIPVADLGELLDLASSRAHTSAAAPPRKNLQQCILIRVGDEEAGFFIDRLLEAQEIIVKPQSPLLKRVPTVAGATILPTGAVCMILNASDLVKRLQQQTNPASAIGLKAPIRRKPTILLVEDSVPVRTQERRLLEKAGYEVVIAVDGLDGYNKLQTQQFDAVMSDVEMPNLDGLSLTAKIRQHQEYKELPIVLVTTLDSEEDKQRGAKAGANAYVIKGRFNQDVLLEILSRLV